MLTSLISVFYDFQKTKKTELSQKELEKNILLHQQYRIKFQEFVEIWQQDFIEMIQSFEKKAKFVSDKWDRSDNKGHGLTCVLQNGEIIEKAGVNTTQITIPFSVKLKKALLNKGKQIPDGQEGDYKIYANGCSVVIHPFNPMAPTTHANFRYLELIDAKNEQVVDFWFGGGVDLTPYYIFEEDCIEFHMIQKEAADSFQPDSFYYQLKKNCDEYFFLKHRNEHRGIGGTFFNGILINDSWEKTFAYVKKAAYSHLQAYKTILERRIPHYFSPENKKWQLVRRGRYVEFNLLFDAGTKFGLFTPDARIESIFMSLPPVVHFDYQFAPKKDSDEEKTMKIICHPQNWI